MPPRLESIFGNGVARLTVLLYLWRKRVVCYQVCVNRPRLGALKQRKGQFWMFMSLDSTGSFLKIHVLFSFQVLYF